LLLVRTERAIGVLDRLAACLIASILFFGLARCARLQRVLGRAVHQAKGMAERTGAPARVFRDFRYATRKSWSRRRRVIGKAEYLAD
jgi:hypothetical protein